MRRRWHDWRLAFGEVRHTRLRPVRHTFRYRAWFLRAPLDELDERAGSWLFGVNRAALISFRSQDHGDGGPLRDWVRAMLSEAGIVADGRIWLHALPRVLGYAFKPVSFWFCHRRDGALVAVIAEVNNTFGERHCYLLADPSGAPLRAGAELQAAKAFHVSPFCSVEGRYRFRFLTTAERAVARIDYEDRDGPLLLTSQSGRFSSVDLAGLVHALFGHPLFTMGVIVRIHWQALRLWAKRVPFRSKPPASPTIVTRGTR
ncbi:MAG: DUF1365 domain-containing protein [Burkholderiales bacterium]|nr:MAG: DUF1365 domain-containing protein [Burkholderiales bacterium]